MFAWKVKRLFREEASELASPSSQYSGANRRAVNLVPLPLAHDSHELAQTKQVRYHQLLISIEGNQRTCCLKIISPKKKSRAALLVFRGRVLGCLYGKRDLDFHYFHQDAHQKAMADLASPGNILDAYQLPEDLVLAAASLFHGQVLEFHRHHSAENMYEAAIQQIMAYGLPGCVVISNGDKEMIAMVYIAGGRILGIYSSLDGWVESSVQAGMRYLESTRNATVMASILPIRTIDDVARLGFSLTGLADRRAEMWRQLHQRQPGVNTMPLRPVDFYEVQMARQIAPVYYPNATRNLSSRYHRHAHRIYV